MYHPHCLHLVNQSNVLFLQIAVNLCLFFGEKLGRLVRKVDLALLQTCFDAEDFE